MIRKRGKLAERMKTFGW